jgi:uncharacterized protein YjiS (DUF1127 family)
MNSTATARPPVELPFLRGLRAALAGWQHRRLQRATHIALAALDARVLRDIGLDRSEIPSLALAAAVGDETRIHVMQLVRRRTELAA